MEEQISQKTMERNLEPISKDAFAEGASDGQKSVFQPSFDAGYAEGMMFGFKLSYENTLTRMSQQTVEDRFTEIQDPMKINCQMCIDNTLENKSISEIKQVQKEMNDNLLQEIKCDM